ncbi:hypothetical protein HDV03_004166, partial [Kappamyces sp. JEL0829]
MLPKLSGIVALALGVLAGPIYLPAPPNKSGPPEVLLFMQGAQIDNERYRDVVAAIQNKVSFPLHAVLPDFAFDVAVPISFYVHK